MDGLTRSSLHQMTIQREKHTIGSRAGQTVCLEKHMLISGAVVLLPSCTNLGAREGFSVIFLTGEF